MAPVLLASREHAARWLAERCRGALRSDSRQVRTGDAYLAWPGRTADGRAYVSQALRTGAAACLVEAEGSEAWGLDDPRIAALPGLKAAAGEVAAAALGDPSSRLEVVAITGTNGKTSSAWWTAQALAGLGRRCAVVGTLGVGEWPHVQPNGLTTPDAVALQQSLREFVDGGVQACAMEASSIGLAEHRMAGTRVAVAVFTNLTQDHLDYHGTMQAYGEAKAALFDMPGLRAAVLNVDDDFGAELALRLAKRNGLDVWTVGLAPAMGATGRADAEVGMADAAPAPAPRLSAAEVRYDAAGLAFTLCEGAAAASVRTGLVGTFNVHNLLGVAAALRALGQPLADVAAALSSLGAVPGRMERVPGPADLAADAAPMVLVDYAHTPDALDKVLQALRPLARSRGGALWCVFGCGGNRDATKRPLMGAIAAQGCDRPVVTSDNPRDETPGDIVRQVLAGAPEGRLRAIEDRAEAIATVLEEAGARDVVLLAGKGHEATQEIAGVKRPFADAQHAAAALALRATRGLQAAPALQESRP